jgi:hypothetical protein
MIDLENDKKVEDPTEPPKRGKAPYTMSPDGMPRSENLSASANVPKSARR